ncbi:MAG: MFS transporter [Alphaproteobacteria bacterium HGW-Alphaproteobacteria-13]|nr:MAG: MFS transporter [Alphaproteobacteria bacterium HGW-Alphaproteobacteria-13]
MADGIGRADGAGEQAGAGRGYSRVLLAMLAFSYVLNVVDRQLVSVLAVPIKAELRLSDTELGLLGGLAFALFYTSLAIPIAWLADRWSRPRVIGIAIGIWSLFTMLCGFASSFVQFFLLRVGVGVGEAGGVAPAHAMISDNFPAEGRARAIGVYSMGLPIGSAARLFLGGWIASLWGWRMAFIAIGLVGLLFTPIFAMTVRDAAAARRKRDAEGLAEGDGEKGPSLRQAAAALLRKPSFLLLAFGSGFGSMAGYGLTFWLPSFASRTLRLPLMDIAHYGSLIALVGGVFGIWLSSWLGDRFGTRNRAAYAMVPAIAAVLIVPLYAAAMLNRDLVLALPLFLLPTILSVAWLGPILAAVQNIVHPSARATASALFLLVNNLMGFVGGTLIFGAMSDYFAARFGPDSLQVSLLAGLGFYLVSALLFALAARRLAADWAS